jgi:hypothetical protein
MINAEGVGLSELSAAARMKRGNFATRLTLIDTSAIDSDKLRAQLSNPSTFFKRMGGARGFSALKGGGGGSICQNSSRNEQPVGVRFGDPHKSTTLETIVALSPPPPPVPSLRKMLKNNQRRQYLSPEVTDSFKLQAGISPSYLDRINFKNTLQSPQPLSPSMLLP